MYYTWKEERAFNEGFELAQRMFSVESKVLGVLSPGAYQAKEALRYGLSEDEYNNRKLGFALKGHFTPLTATIIKKKAEKRRKC